MMSEHQLLSYSEVILSQLAPGSHRLKACSVVLYRSPSHLSFLLNHSRHLQSLDSLQSLSSLLAEYAPLLRFDSIVNSRQRSQKVFLP